MAQNVRRIHASDNVPRHELKRLLVNGFWEI
ncbi:hypothetical protein I41_26810 [Lacipirellula limnantheis]|uniref:Uncharacterized protein n=1 Tax=Lacipirellula limnantheis TaxID=2528024 RepID=A0A517TYP4_9BACT|nr:hypothetical protein I41_26810 [Lacipirellula limnantheis]